jgi:DNA-binding MarR family transcriptional regulator
MSQIDLNNIPNPLDYPGFLILQKANVWEKYVNAKLIDFGLTLSEIFQLISLVILSQKQDEVTQVDLSQLSGVSAMSVSKILKLLEKKKLVVRTVGRDSRSKALSITSKGLDILINSSKLLDEANKQYFPKDGADTFVKYLKKIKQK